VVRRPRGRGQAGEIKGVHEGGPSAPRKLLVSLLSRELGGEDGVRGAVGRVEDPYPAQ
jgi:hypothetical protein